MSISHYSLIFQYILLHIAQSFFHVVCFLRNRLFFIHLSRNLAGAVGSDQLYFSTKKSISYISARYAP